jgi:hypothetical protein
MTDTNLHQIFIQERSGDLIPSNQYTTIDEWEKTKFCFDADTVHDHTQYTAFKQVTPTIKHWIFIKTFSLI